MASVKSAMTLSYSSVFESTCLDRVGIASFGSSRMASVKSAMALSYSPVSRVAPSPRPVVVSRRLSGRAGWPR